MESSKKIVIWFKTESDKVYKFSVPDVKETLTREDVERVANKIIVENILFTDSGDVKSLEKAQIITTTTEEL